VAGDRIAKTLGELKGAVMKVGQMASIGADILPREVSDALMRLQQEAPPMGYEVICEQIEAELGAPPERLFRRFDHVPCASASIGQVHRAQAEDGREVVCKIQYPGVDGAVDSDLWHLRMALQASGIVPLGRKALKASFEELKARLHEELDYTLEAENVRRFSRYHERHPFVRIPEVVGERSSKRVLTLTFETGDAFHSLGELRYSQADIDRIGEHIMTFIAAEIFELGAIHADPNPGNFRVRRDGTLIVYDFGCVKRLDPKIVEAYRDIIVQGLAERYDEVPDTLRRLEILRADAAPLPEAFYRRWRDIFGQPFLDHRNFDFGRTDIHRRVIAEIPDTLRHIPAFQPSKELIFLDRMVAGHYGNLRTLKTTIAVLQVVEPYLQAFARERLLSAGWT
jgi:predicted unusual protein kinase regulating ubiquinone biosynthesis (AarF/ABC1/UbiB family)